MGAGYARAIHRFRAGFTDCSRYRYLLAKHFEVPATGALLLADRAAAPLLRRLGMVEGEHDVTCSQDDLEDTVRFVLDPGNHRELDAVRRRGQQLVWQAHTVRQRARLIDELLSPARP